MEMTENGSAGLGVAVPQDDPDMHQAFLEARRTIEQFIQYLQAPTPTQEYFGVKVRLSGDDRNEYLWVRDVAYDGVAFIGTIGNESDLTPLSRKSGAEYKARLNEIYDWMIVDKGKLVGGYTVRVARNKMTPENRKLFDAMLWFAVE